MLRAEMRRTCFDAAVLPLRFYAACRYARKSADGGR